MRLLLDTHIVIWWVTGDPKLTATVRSRLDAADSELYLSSVTAIELSIKSAIGKLPLSKTPQQIIGDLMAQTPLIPLPIRIDHGLRLLSVPFYHRDPFDRLLVAQALVDDLIIVSADAKLAAYPVRVIG